MEISSLTLPLPSSLPKTIPFSSSSFSNSAFFRKPNITATTPLVFGRTRPRRTGLICNSLFGLGVPELAVIAGVAALVFGPSKLPEVGRSFGKTIKSFQQAAKEFESELKKEPEAKEEALAEKPAALSIEEKQEVNASSSKESI